MTFCPTTLFILILVLLPDLIVNRREQKIFKISVLYDDHLENIEDLISYSFDSVNQIFRHSKFQLDFSSHKVDKAKAYKLTQKLCYDLEEGRIAIIVIGESPAFKIIESISNSLNVPYIEVKWNALSEEYSVLSSMNDIYNNSWSKFSKINIHPPSNKLIKAYIDLIEFYKWEYVTILYQESTGLTRIDDLLKIPQNLSILTGFPNQNTLSSKFRVIVKQLSTDPSNWFNLINEVKLSGSSHVIVDLSTKYLNKFLEIAEDAGLMTTYFHILFTTLDLAAFDYTPSANVTAFQMFQPNDMNVRNVFAEFNLKNMISQKPMFKFMPSSAIFIHDAIMVVAKTIQEKKLVDFLPEFPAISCDTEKKWSYGEQMLNHMKNIKVNGLSGNIEFDKNTGYRKNITLSIVDRTKNGVELIGFWKDSGSKPISFIRSYAKEKDHILNKLNRNLIVTTKIEAPYVMIKTTENNETLEGNDKYQGYCVDLLVKISKICGFNYTIKPVADGVHGTLVDGKWNGIINELIDKKADIAVAGLTITYQREQAIDFTKPFLNLGISILYKRQQKIDPNIFSFLSPLSIDIWLYIIGAYLFVSLLLFVLSRFSPYEWKNPHPCKKESELVENQFTLNNSLWFTIGSLMKQGSDINPKSFSARILTGVWWFFALIMISSYTANLAAFLTTKRLSSPIEDVEGLSKQSEIKYGCLNGGSTQQFFRESKIHTYERMWNFMNSQPDVFVSSPEEGIARVKKGGYAYLVESTTNDYLRQRDCELMQVGGLIDTKGYGIGTPPGSPWRDQISNAILQLQEKGDLQELYIKWWEKEGKDPNQKCDHSEDKKKDSANELSLANVGGIFVVLAIGLILSFFVAILEFYFKTRKHLRHQNLPEKIFRRLKVACCHHQPIRRSSSLKTLDLNNEIKLIAPNDNTKYSLSTIRNNRTNNFQNFLLNKDMLGLKYSNSMSFGQTQAQKPFKNKKSKSYFFQNLDDDMLNKKYHYSYVNKPAYKQENYYLKRRLSPVHLNEIDTRILTKNFSDF